MSTAISPIVQHFYHVKTVQAFTYGYWRRYLIRTITEWALMKCSDKDNTRLQNLVSKWSRLISSIIPVISIDDISDSLFWYNPFKPKLETRIHQFVTETINSFVVTFKNIEAKNMNDPNIPWGNPYNIELVQDLLKRSWDEATKSKFSHDCQIICFPSEWNKHLKLLDDANIAYANIWTIYNEVTSALYPGTDYISKLNQTIKEFPFPESEQSYIQQCLRKYYKQLYTWNKIILVDWEYTITNGTNDSKEVILLCIEDLKQENKQEYKLLCDTKTIFTTPNEVFQKGIHLYLLKIWNRFHTEVGNLLQIHYPQIYTYLDITPNSSTNLIDLLISCLIHTIREDKVLHFMHYYNYLNIDHTWIKELLSRYQTSEPTQTRKHKRDESTQDGNKHHKHE